MEPSEFASLYALAYPKLSVIAIAIVGNRTDADDLIQQSVVIALENIEQFRPSSDFTRWMSAILRNVASNHLRKTKIRKTSRIDPSDAHSAETDPGLESVVYSAAHKRIDGLENAFDDEVRSAVESLAEEPRICLLLRIVLDLDYREISELVGIPEGTAMSHVHRGKRRLRSLLNSYLD